MEQTGTVDAIVNVMHDLFPDDEEDNNAGIDESVNDITASTEHHEATPSVDSARSEQTEDTESVAGAQALQSSSSQKARDQQRDQKSDRLAFLLFPLLDLLAEVSSHDGCAEVLVVTGALHYVTYVLENIANAQDELLPLCLLILWNVLELGNDKIKSITKCASRKELLIQYRLRNATYFLGNEFAFCTLLHVLELLLREGYRKQDKELRNELLMILLLLSKRRKNLDYFYSTGITNCLLSYAIASEHARIRATSSEGLVARSAVTANVHHYATNSDEDFEFKQTLWYLIAEIMHEHEANLAELVQFRLVETLLSYATYTIGSDPTNKSTTGGARTGLTSAAMKYSGPQLEILQTIALSVLNHVVPFVLDHFYEIRGHEILVDFLSLNIGSDAVLAAAWLLMVQVATPEPYFQSAMAEIGAIAMAVNIFESPASRHTFAIRRNAIIACASMCRNEERNRKRFFDANGVHILAQHVQFDESHAILEENILIGVLEAVRSCVVGDTISEAEFIAADGVSRLLSVLVRTPKAIKHQALAALAEISVNPGAIPSYMDWRCGVPGPNNNATANEILLRIYADEEEAETLFNADVEGGKASLNNSAVRFVAADNIRHSSFQSISRCDNPIIVSPPSTDRSGSDESVASTARPQSPAFARLKEALKAAQSISLEKKPAVNSAGSILALGDKQVHPEVNLKAKIHAVLANVAFACDADKLTPRDQVMLEIAKEYPTYKIGEMWQNVQLELQAEGVRPIYADTLFIRKQIEHAYNASVCTKNAQKEIFSRAKQLDDEQENELFKRILLQKHQDEQAARIQRANRLQNSTLRLHFEAKKTRLEFMRRQDPAAFAAYEKNENGRIEDPAPEYVDVNEASNTLQQKEQELRGRMSTIATKHK